MRHSLPSTLLTVSLPTSVGALLRGIVGEDSRIERLPTFLDAMRGLQQYPDACVVVAVPQERELHLVFELERALAWRPTGAVLAVFLTQSCVAALLEFGRIGVTQIVREAEFSKAHALRDALVACQNDAVSARAWRSCEDAVPSTLATLLKTALRLSHRPLTVARLASGMQLTSRGLRNLCEEASLPSPTWITLWTRVLIATAFLENGQRTITDAAAALGFPSSSMLRAQLQQFGALDSEGVPFSDCVARVVRAVSFAMPAASASQKIQARIEHVSLKLSK